MRIRRQGAPCNLQAASPDPIGEAVILNEPRFAVLMEAIVLLTGAPRRVGRGTAAMFAVE